MKKRFSEGQIIGFLREAESGLSVKDLCRRHDFSEASYYLWRSKFGGMTVSEAKRLRELETENMRLKKLLAEHAPHAQTPARATLVHPADTGHELPTLRNPWGNRIEQYVSICRIHAQEKAPEAAPPCAFKGYLYLKRINPLLLYWCQEGQRKPSIYAACQGPL